jgi:hypothetical protein
MFLGFSGGYGAAGLWMVVMDLIFGGNGYDFRWRPELLFGDDRSCFLVDKKNIK